MCISLEVHPVEKADAWVNRGILVNRILVTQVNTIYTARIREPLKCMNFWNYKRKQGLYQFVKTNPLLFLIAV
jgi:hypothetical protein